VTGEPFTCTVCAKHQRKIELLAGPVYEDELFYIGHSTVPEEHDATYLGAFLIEPKRHVSGLDELGEVEAERLGLLANRVARALRASEGAEHVYLFVLGHHVPHLHAWVVPRYPGTPREFWGLRVMEWQEARRGGFAEVAVVCERVRDALRR
jgi:diadenosine tetraphosphate (Ap4A) HIT family hydrolase